MMNSEIIRHLIRLTEHSAKFEGPADYDLYLRTLNWPKMQLPMHVDPMDNHVNVHSVDLAEFSKEAIRAAQQYRIIYGLTHQVVRSISDIADFPQDLEFMLVRGDKLLFKLFQSSLSKECRYTHVPLVISPVDEAGEFAYRPAESMIKVDITLHLPDKTTKSPLLSLYKFIVKEYIARHHEVIHGQAHPK